MRVEELGCVDMNDDLQIFDAGSADLAESMQHDAHLI